MASRSPLVSAIVPTRDRVDLLERALRSVLAQEGVQPEVIVVDDASSDGTPRLLAGLGDRVRVIRTDRNIERGAARNLGARAARGTLLAFLDSDDEWKADKLAHQLAVAGTEVPSVTGVAIVDADGRTIRSSYVPPADASSRLFDTNAYVGAPSSLMIPAELFHAVGGFPESWGLQGSEDWVFLIKLAASGHRIAIVPQPLVRYRVHEGSSTADPDLVAVAMWSAVEYLEHEGLVCGEALRQARFRRAESVARRFAVSGRFREAAGWALRAGRIGTSAEALRAGVLISSSMVSGGLRRVGLRRAA